jgi:membrane-bound metal-dependent hydrolase YbcI (DUF457 family)
MNTPSHCVLNLAILGLTIAPQATLPIALGAIVPDVPIFAFYFWAKVLKRFPESEIWSAIYYQSNWQTLFALSHSLPIALVGLLIFAYLRSTWGMVFCDSLILHSLLDFPVHHNDAHRHFFPLSNYRFISPISYWDPNHYGGIVAGVEWLAVLSVTPWVFGLLNNAVPRVILITINVLYTLAYSQFYLIPAIAHWFLD